MARHLINANVNGDNVEFVCSTAETLLDVIRGELRLTGQKMAAVLGTAEPVLLF